MIPVLIIASWEVRFWIIFELSLTICKNSSVFHCKPFLSDNRLNIRIMNLGNNSLESSFYPEQSGVSDFWLNESEFWIQRVCLDSVASRFLGLVVELTRNWWHILQGYMCIINISRQKEFHFSDSAKLFSQGYYEHYNLENAKSDITIQNAQKLRFRWVMTHDFM